MFPLYDDNPTARAPAVTLGIIALNALVFLATLSLPEAERQELYFHRGFVPARIRQLKTGQPLDVAIRQEAVPRWFRGPWRVQKVIRLEPDPPRILLSLVTCMFLHGGWLHLIGNMWFLWIFGNNVEDRLGPLPYLLFYLVGGLAASACHWATGPGSVTPVIGASGAVAAVLGAYAITWPSARVHTLVVLIIFVTVVDLPALLVLGLWFVGQLLEARRAIALGVSGGVAWWAHVGGFIAGLAMMLVLTADDERPRPRRRALPVDVVDDEDLW